MHITNQIQLKILSRLGYEFKKDQGIYSISGFGYSVHGETASAVINQAFTKVMG